MPRIAPEELGRLYREHAPALRLYARQWPEGGEDLVQDAFMKLAQQSPAPQAVLPWLYCVVRNGALSASRGRARRRRREDRASAAEAWFSAADEQFEAREAAQLLGELPLEQREVIVARIWGGLTFEELARLAGCSLATAHRRYQDGLAALRERLFQVQVQSPWNRKTPTAKTV
jgi:RNA polymerase sigma-70 factor (ECF subfamily)